MHRCTRCGARRPWLAPAGRLAVLALLTLLAGPTFGAPQVPPSDPAELLRAHVASLGGEALLAGLGDVVLNGRIEVPGTTLGWRAFVRREPFTLREEWYAPQGDAPTNVQVTNTARYWDLLGPTGDRSRPIPFGEIKAFPQRAFLWRLLFAPHALWETALPGTTRVLAEAPFLHDDFAEGRQARSLTLFMPDSMPVEVLFDAQDGRWLAGQLASGDEQHRLRAGRWRHEAGMLLPGVVLAYTDAGLSAALFLDGVETGLSHADALFGQDPGAPPPGTRDALALACATADLPESCYVVVGGLRLLGQGPYSALYDSGAGDLLIDPALVSGLRLPYMNRTRFGTLDGHAHVGRHWVAELGLGEERVLQLPALSFPLPAFLEAMGRPQMVLGAPVVEGRSPVLDLERGRLLLRGDPPEPLWEIVARTRGEAESAAVGKAREATASTAAPAAAGRDVALLPTRRAVAQNGLRTVPVTLPEGRLDALFDTGSPYLLRISVAGLRRLGLPVGTAPWLQRGGRPFRSAGLVGETLPDVLVRLPELRLEAEAASDGRSIEVVFERPWVLVATTTAAYAEPPFDAILGGSLLRAMARVGFDQHRELLELQAGPHVAIETGPAAASAAGGKPAAVAVPEVWRVPAPGQELGFSLAPSSPGAVEGSIEALPKLAEVRPGSPAARHGFEAGDRLLSVDGVPCYGTDPLLLWPSLWPAEGEHVRVEALRAGGMIRIAADLP